MAKDKGNREGGKVQSPKLNPLSNLESPPFMEDQDKREASSSSSLYLKEVAKNELNPPIVSEEEAGRDDEEKVDERLKQKEIKKGEDQTAFLKSLRNLTLTEIDSGKTVQLLEDDERASLSIPSIKDDNDGVETILLEQGSKKIRIVPTKIGGELSDEWDVWGVLSVRFKGLLAKCSKISHPQTLFILDQRSSAMIPLFAPTLKAKYQSTLDTSLISGPETIELSKLQDQEVDLSSISVGVEEFFIPDKTSVSFLLLTRDYIGEGPVNPFSYFCHLLSLIAPDILRKLPVNTRPPHIKVIRAAQYRKLMKSLPQSFKGESNGGTLLQDFILMCLSSVHLLKEEKQIKDKPLKRLAAACATASVAVPEEIEAKEVSSEMLSQIFRYSGAVQDFRKSLVTYFQGVNAEEASTDLLQIVKAQTKMVLLSTLSGSIGFIEAMLGAEEITNRKVAMRPDFLLQLTNFTKDFDEYKRKAEREGFKGNGWPLMLAFDRPQGLTRRACPLVHYTAIALHCESNQTMLQFVNNTQYLAVNEGELEQHIKTQFIPSGNLTWTPSSRATFTKLFGRQPVEEISPDSE